jgi:hypothetical protein
MAAHEDASASTEVKVSFQVVECFCKRVGDGADSREQPLPQQPRIDVVFKATHELTAF